MLIAGNMQPDGTTADGPVFHIVFLFAADLSLKINLRATTGATGLHSLKAAHDHSGQLQTAGALLHASCKALRPGLIVALFFAQGLQRAAPSDDLVEHAVD